MSSLPSYVAAAKPVPAANAQAWYKNIAPTYAGIMLWFVFWQKIAVGGDAKPWRGCSFAGRWNRIIRIGDRRLDLPLLLLSCARACWDMKTGLPLYVVGTSTYGATGGLFMPGFLMGLLQFGWLAVNAYRRGDVAVRVLWDSAQAGTFHPSLAHGLIAAAFAVICGVCRTEGHSIRGQSGHLSAVDSAGGAHSVGGEDGGRDWEIQS